LACHIDWRIELGEHYAARYTAAMRRLLLLALVGLASGCSNAPVAGFLDCVAPARGGDAGREAVMPRIRPPGTEPLPPPAATNDVLPPIAPR
jgi:hypothetical protein